MDENFQKILSTVRAYPDQITQAWEEIEKVNIPDSYKNTSNVAVFGMGGSALGGRIVDSLFFEKARGPIEIFTDYSVPAYVNENTLAVLSSYSGNTEETISAFHKAYSQNAKIFGITTGGQLASLLKEKKLPAYFFEPKNNPSGQPRMALGYAISSLLALLGRLGFVSITSDEVKEAKEELIKIGQDYDESSPESANLAKNFALLLKGKIPVLVSSEHLVGICHAFKNQLNESSKSGALLFDIPELNHHLMEGLKNPAKARELFHFIFFESNLYHERVAKRYQVTKEVVEKNGYPFSVYPLRAPKPLSQVFEVLVFGSFVSLYLAASYKENPTQIPWVDYFKKKLSE